MPARGLLVAVVTVSVKISASLPGAGGSLAKQLTHQAGELALAVGGRPQFLSTWASPRTA